MRQPHLTVSLIGLCSIVFISLALGDLRGLSIEFLKIWDGAYYLILVAAFVHVDPFHLIVNMAWLWALGWRVEAVMGRQALLALVFFGALATSGTQLAVGGDWPAVGISGVVCVLFGFVLACRPRNPLFRLYLTPQAVRYFIGWLVLCILASNAGIWPVGNTGHVAGFLFGLATGYLFGVRRWRMAASLGLVVLTVLTVLSLTWLPWSAQWRMWHCLRRLETGRVALARGDMEFVKAHGTPRTQNRLAWILATSHDDRYRQGQWAIELAARACEGSKWRESEIIDTLGAAYAEAGEWDKAVEIESKAIRVHQDRLDTSRKKWLFRVLESRVPDIGDTYRENLRKMRQRQKIRD